MPRHLAPLSALVVLMVGLSTPVALSAQTGSAASLERWIRSGYEFSWVSGQPMREEVRQVWSQLGSGGVGYGFRTFQARKGAPDSVPSMEYWRVTLDELHTSVVGSIGLAWGVHTESFKAKGQPPDTVRVRFTNTLRWNGQRWENLLYHRDAQAFRESGGYLAAGELAAVPVPVASGAGPAQAGATEGTLSPIGAPVGAPARIEAGPACVVDLTQRYAVAGGLSGRMEINYRVLVHGPCGSPAGTFDEEWIAHGRFDGTVKGDSGSGTFVYTARVRDGGQVSGTMTFGGGLGGELAIRGRFSDASLAYSGAVGPESGIRRR